jgi:hypothetical protein
MIRRRFPVIRSCLLLAALALPAVAAPQLKARKPAPGTEEARIEALRARYDEALRGDDPELRRAVERAKEKVGVLIRLLDEIPKSPRVDPAAEARVRRIIDEDPRLKDLYNIAMYDRRAAAEK